MDRCLALEDFDTQITSYFSLRSVLLLDKPLCKRAVCFCGHGAEGGGLWSEADLHPTVAHFPCHPSKFFWNHKHQVEENVL